MNKERPSLTIVRRIKASPAKVYTAWTRPEFMARWWGPDGGPVLSAQADPHVSGRFRVVFQTLDGLTHDCQGEYREVVRERKLVFTRTQFDDETTRDDHRRGWNSAFDKLETLVAQPAERMSHGTA